MQVEEHFSTDLPRQLNHLQVPRTQTVISVHRPVGYVVTVAKNVPVEPSA